MAALVKASFSSDVFRALLSASADEKGGIAVMGAVILLPLTLLAFAAVEMHSLSNAHESLQDALDGATLAVARSSETDPAKLEALGRTVLLASLSSSSYGLGSSSFGDVDGTVTGSAAVSVSSVVSSLFGVTHLSTSASSQAARLGRKLEVSLVLDNTFSMLTNNRLGITKVAAAAFVDQLGAAAAKTRVSDALKISLVPYSTTVNVGPAYANADWMDGRAANSTHDDIFTPVAGHSSNRFTLLSQMGVSWAGCVESRPYPYDVSDAPPRSTTPDTLFVPYFAPDEHDEWTQSTFRISNNYLPDRSTDSDWSVRQKNPAKYVVAPAVSSWSDSGYSAGPNYGCTLQPLVRLTTNLDSVKAGIAAMTPTGDTYTNIGLVWGWHTLSPHTPFADGAAYSAPVQKIIVLMTDGENAAYNNGSPNASVYSGGGYIGQGRFGITAGSAAERRAALDARMSQVCSNAKAQGVIIYTIRVEVSSASNVVRDCATDPEKFYDVRAAAELDAVFDRIARSLLNLRLAA